MFSISDKDIAAIVAASERGGEWSATIEVRRLFPGIPNNAEALRVAMVIAGWEAMPTNPREPHTPPTVASRCETARLKETVMKVLMLGVLLLVAGISAASAQSCRQTAGAAKAQEMARQCAQVSEATHPPCNAVNPCDMMVDEIRRSCAMRRKARVQTPAFCNQYR